MKPPILPTPRLLLRRWADDDREAFARINADPRVARYRSTPLTPAESDELIDDIEACFDEHGFGQWVVERIADRRVIGFIGLEVAGDDAPFSPRVHIGWHLDPDAWGSGYATEGAAAVLDYVFSVVGLPEVVAHTTNANAASQAVMHRLGMSHDATDDFDAPWYPAGDPHGRFVLYRMTAAAWRSEPRRAAPGDRRPA